VTGARFAAKKQTLTRLLVFLDSVYFLLKLALFPVAMKNEDTQARNNKADSPEKLSARQP
jgi:hypothetical protein